MRRSAHGGKCCGITHIYCFEDYWLGPVMTKEKWVKQIKSKIEAKLYNHYYRSHLFEIVLIDEQLIPTLKEALKDLGFKMVTRFINSNSGNRCNVFHMATNQPKV